MTLGLYFWAIFYAYGHDKLKSGLIKNQCHLQTTSYFSTWVPDFYLLTASTSKVSWYLPIPPGTNSRLPLPQADQSLVLCRFVDFVLSQPDNFSSSEYGFGHKVTPRIQGECEVGS